MRRSNLTRRPGDCFANGARNDAAEDSRESRECWRVILCGDRDGVCPHGEGYRLLVFQIGQTRKAMVDCQYPLTAMCKLWAEDGNLAQSQGQAYQARHGNVERRSTCANVFRS
jgi:hypothetical protein